MSHSQEMVSVLREQFRKPIEIPEEKIFSPILGLVLAVTDLVNYGRIVWDDRISKKNSKQWDEAYDAIEMTQEAMVRGICFDDKKSQVYRIYGNLDNIEKMTDVKRWKTFCGRSHTVPVEKIQKVKEELENFKLKIKK